MGVARRVDRPGGQGLGAGSVNGQWSEVVKRLAVRAKAQTERAEQAEARVRELQAEVARLQEVKHG